MGVVLLTGACATTPPSFRGSGLSELPADTNIAFAARVPALREPIAAIVDEAGVSLPKWLLERVSMLHVGIYAGSQIGYLAWIKGENLDGGLKARLLLSPDWLYVSRPFAHFRSVHSAVLLPGDDVLVLTNLPLGHVLASYEAEAFTIPLAAAAAATAADIILIVPDLTEAVRGLAADSGLDTLTEAFRINDFWVSATTSAEAISISGAFGTGDPRLARLLVALAGRISTLADVRLQADEASVTLAGLMRYEELIKSVRAVLVLTGESESRR